MQLIYMQIKQNYIQVIVQMKPERVDHSCEGVLFTANYLHLLCSYLPIGAFETS